MVLAVAAPSREVIETREARAEGVPGRFMGPPEGSEFTPQVTLRALAQSRGIQIGTAVSSGPLQREKDYRETLRREFNLVTPENAMKFDALHPTPTRYVFSDSDAMEVFARSNGMGMRGHTLVWHESLPPWLRNERFSRGDLMAILRDHIRTVVSHFRGRIGAWDVVNEAIADDGSMRDTFWLRGIGPEYIDLAYRWAHEADPAARLFYNDNGGEGLGRKSDAIFDLVKGLVQRGVPIHGVGFQFHINLELPPNMRGVSANMNRMVALGLEVHITEMDVRIRKPVTEEKLSTQARIYRDTLRVCLSAKNCRAFVTWGFTDRHSWIPQFFPAWSAGLIFDEMYRPKLAYHALLNALRGS